MTEVLQSHNASVEQAITDCLAKLKRHNLTIERPTLGFDQRGAIAGSAHLQRNHIKLNKYLLQKYPAFFVDEVIPHEIAHLVVAKHYKQIRQGLTNRNASKEGNNNRVSSWVHKLTQRHSIDRPRPHGQEWQFVMRDIFRLPAHAKHKLPLTDAGVKVFQYKCDCSNHDLTVRRHNKIIRDQAVYRCKKCNAQLVLNRADTSE